MASCLYECLCEAELGKYYPHFAAFGLQKIDELAKVTMEDYSKLGIHNMNDRKRLFQLIKIIQIMQEEDKATDSTPQDFLTSDLYIHPQAPPSSGPRRQLCFDAFANNKKQTAGDFAVDTCNLSDFYSADHKPSLVDMLEHILPGDTQYNKKPRTPSAASADTCVQTATNSTAVFSPNNLSPLLGDIEVPTIQRVTHISGYNYGIPRSYVRENISEKDDVWTETEKIRVCVRKRPLGTKEEKRGEFNIITVEDKETLLVSEKKEAVDLSQYILQHVFYFDEVFGETCTNQDVYMKTTHPLIQHIFNGGNATCFAYGQTGAGKTYTMIGTHQNPGLYALAAEDIFKQIDIDEPRKDLSVWISFYEIYCGQLYDLLNGRKRLFAREDSKHVVQIVGLQELPVDNVTLLLEVILKGGKERSTGATGVNSDSSRSHAIIQIQIKDSAKRTFGRISFIDLAGSERAADARDSDKQTKIEGAEINQSLLALKECIRALDQEHAHTPFRQSKLTQVLKDSFIGNSKTCMIANVSPSHMATEHTLNTLRYADRVKELKKGIKCYTPVTSRNRPTGNVTPKRIQCSPSGLLGDKCSPKKVKLGFQQPLTSAFSTTRGKCCPLTFHSTSVPFSSTPKAMGKSHASKGSPNYAWVIPTTPTKEKTESPPKKKTEDCTLGFEKFYPNKDLAGNLTTAAVLENRGTGLGGTCVPSQFKKGSAVQKQVVPRGGFSFGDPHHGEPCSHTCEKVLNTPCPEAWTTIPPHQKDREAHLRFYHQQFQQPPLLQQKLISHPLEQFLFQYNPQEIRLQLDTPPYSQNQDATQLEDFDDSDFSEDSFSPTFNQKTAKRRNTLECIEHSFFLHQRKEQGTEEQKIESEKNLFFNYKINTQENDVNKNCVYTRNPTCLDPAELNKGHHYNKSLNDRSLEDNMTSSGSSPRHNLAEQPYCSQVDFIHNRRRDNNLAFDHKHFLFKNEPRVQADGTSLLPEKDTSTLSALNFAIQRGSVILPQEESRDSNQTQQMKPMKRNNLNAKGDFCEISGTSAESTSWPVAPLTISLLESTDKEAANELFLNQMSRSPQRKKQVLNVITMNSEKCDKEVKIPNATKDLTAENASTLGMDKPTLDSDSKSTLLLSLQSKDQWFLSGSAAAAMPDNDLANISAIHQVSVNNLSVSEGNVEESLEDKVGTMAFRNIKCQDYINSKHYEADTEETVLTWDLSSPQKTHPEESPGVSLQPTSPMVPADVPEKGFSSSPTVLTNARNVCSSNQPLDKENKLQKTDSPFKLAFSSEEIGQLKHRLIQSIFTESGFLGEHVASSLSAEHLNSPTSSQSSPFQLVRERYKETLIQAHSPLYQHASLFSHHASNGFITGICSTRQIVIQAHQEQLDKMAELGFKEESLINQMSGADFEDFVTQLDEIMVLKSECIQSLRDHLKLYLACCRPEAVLERTSSS
ncbi:kinesin-like protein KIF24 isoform X2 [Monodelphis domestica]|uniref:Kinesin-like protein KIF24 n=1 Tax=Monodelphis domestica TaxID=13616 RepID=A0A5F8GX18_MONDO|nr:kinesin-like protein KIF24 isoform X2 [Monodelphis domestica]